MRLVARAVALSLAARASAQTGAASGCELVDGLCLCSDGEAEWDVTALHDFGDIGPVIGPCSGIFCDGNWNYHFSLCGNVQIIPGIGCSTNANAAAFRIDEWTACPPSTNCECEIIGQDVSTTSLDVSAIDGDESGVLIEYAFLTRSMTLSIICDSSAATDSMPEEVTEASTAVTMEWRTPHLCGGGAIGWMIVIVAGVAAGLYVGGGVGYATRTSTSSSVSVTSPASWEPHPHYDLWLQVPDLVRDGVTFTRAKLLGDASASSLQKKPDRGKGGYDAIDKASSSEQSSLLEGDGKKQQKKTPPSRARKAKGGDVEEGGASEEEGGDERRPVKKKKKRKKKPLPAADGAALE